jgi:EAL domain-containing protein (putative c-di-GMP-specific phosphodiesterase class I)
MPPPIAPAEPPAAHVAQGARTCRSCAACQSVATPFRFAYQPIVDLQARRVWGHEALVRGPAGEAASTVLEQIDHTARYDHDQALRVRALKGAARLGLLERLSLNILPLAADRPDECLRTTLDAARCHDFPAHRLMFEVAESEGAGQRAGLTDALRAFRRAGVLTALDRFTAGRAALQWLAETQPDIVKLDRRFVHGIDQHPARQAAAATLLRLCREQGIEVIAVGIESAGERDFFGHAGVTLMQGHWFCRPAFDARGIIAPAAWSAPRSIAPVAFAASIA